MQENKNNRSFKIITVIALCVAVICLSVAYAALSQQLNIEGTATVQKATWDVHLEKEATGYETVGDAEVSQLDVPDKSTTVSSLSVKLKKPGDKATIKLKAVNGGDIDATLTNVTKLNVSCEGQSDSAENDQKLICGATGDGSDGNVTFSVTYDDVPITANGIGTLTGHTDLDATNSKVIKIVIEYDNAKTTELPKNDVTVTLSGLSFNYAQKNIGG